MRLEGLFVLLMLLSLPYAQETPNIILISLDTVRADHMGVYGYEHNTTPNIDGFAKEGVIFRNGVASATWTLPAHASMVTGLNPINHGAIELDKSNVGKCMLKRDERTLQGILNEQGYETAGIVNWYYAAAGSSKDFKEFQVVHKNPTGNFTDEEVSENEKTDYDGFIVNERAFSWLEKNKGNNFFLLLHYYDAHSPYNHPEYAGMFFDVENYDGAFKNQRSIKPNKWFDSGRINTTEDIDALVGYYDAGVYYEDLVIGELFSKLKELGLYEDTLIILVSDHGESLSEHGHFSHHHEPYEQEIVVPFIIRYPGFGKGEVRETVSHVDIVPTVLEVLGIEEGGFDGRSLVPLIRGEKSGFVGRGLNVLGGDACECLVTGALRTDATKVMYWVNVTGNEITGSQVFAVYELTSDPGEERNLINEIEIVEQIESTCEHWDCKLSDLEIAVIALSLIVLIAIISYSVADFAIKLMRKN